MGLFGMNNNQWGNLAADPSGLANGKTDPGHLFNPKASGDDSMLTTALGQYPQYQSTYDPSTQSMTAYLQSIMPQYDAGYQQLKSDALNKGQSGWLNMTLDANDAKLQDQKEHAMLQNAGQTASARDNLASIGGLTSGARERVAEQGQKNFMGMSQDLSRQSDLSDLSARGTDEQNKVSQLGQLTTAEEGKQKDWENARQQDITNQQTETGRLNEYNMNLYNTKMTALAADRQAQATENSGKK